uniref:Uncharacterized protein n=1 Tax=Strigamia maritima TaxID=126957 RepID=T1J325_STRMM
MNITLLNLWYPKTNISIDADVRCLYAINSTQCEANDWLKYTFIDTTVGPCLIFYSSSLKKIMDIKFIILMVCAFAVLAQNVLASEETENSDNDILERYSHGPDRKNFQKCLRVNANCDLNADNCCSVVGFQYICRTGLWGSWGTPSCDYEFKSSGGRNGGRRSVP